MERLIAFGCSFTFGHGLPDCFLPPTNPGPRPSRQAWPSLVAEQLGRKCINESWPGSSNKRIWKSIIDFKFKDSDIVFILWTRLERHSLFKNTGSRDFIPADDDDLLYYQNFYDEYDSEVMSSLYISHANFYLQSKNIKTYNLLVNKKYKKILFKDQSINLIPYYLGHMMHDYPLALDKSHPGEEVQKVFASKIMSYINEPKNEEFQNFFMKLKKYF